MPRPSRGAARTAEAPQHEPRWFEWLARDGLTVQGSAVIKLFANPVVGFKDLPLNTTEWYCKGVGLVKVQRAEPAHSTFLAGRTMTLEWTEWP